MKLLLLLLLVPQLALSCPKPVMYLKKSTTAPCNGYLFSPEKELEVRLLKENYKLQAGNIDIIKKQSELYQAMNEEFKAIANKEAERAELWRQATITTTKDLVSRQESQTYRDFLFIGLGVLLTVSAGWSLGQVK